MQEGGGSERSYRTQAELGRLLAVAEGYRVLASDGTHVGWLDHLRYERHVDHPDEIVVRSRRLLARRRRVLPFIASATTIARWLREDALKPWQYRHHGTNVAFPPQGDSSGANSLAAARPNAIGAVFF